MHLFLNFKMVHWYHFRKKKSTFSPQDYGCRPRGLDSMSLNRIPILVDLSKGWNVRQWSATSPLVKKFPDTACTHHILRVPEMLYRFCLIASSLQWQRLYVWLSVNGKRSSQVKQETDDWQQYFVGLKFQAIFIFSISKACTLVCFCLIISAEPF